MKYNQVLSACAVIAIAGTAANAQSINWLNPVDGNWITTTNWDMGNVPDATGETAVLGLMGPYTVFTTTNISVGAITISNPDATLSIGSSQHTLLGDLMNTGTVVVNTNADIFNRSLIFSTDATISGSGAIVLNGLGNIDDASISVGNGFTVTHENGHTIRGSGRLLGAINNNGLVIADEPLGVGLLLNGTLDQTGGGMAGADNGGTLQLSAGTTIGGELFTDNGGTITVSGSNHHFDGVNLTGDLIIPGNSRNLIIDSTFQNNGTITLNPDLMIFNATLVFDNDSTIEGTGSMTLHSAGDYNDARLQCSGMNTVTIGSGQLIEGSGLLDAGASGTMINQGTINANDAAQPLGLAGAHTGDGGIYRADGGELNLRGGALISNAEFDSSGLGRVQLDIGGTATVIDSTNEGNMHILGSSGTLDIGGTITNNGTISLNPDLQIFNANMRTTGNTIIGGSGSIVMRQVGSTHDARIYAQDGGSLTIGSNQTVRGSGIIETTGTPDGSIINLGTINADDAAFDKTPARPLELTGHHDGMGVGIYRSDDGILQLGGGLDISNGTFDSSGDGFVGVINGGSATISNMINLGDMRILGDGGNIVIADDFTNEGTLTINSNASIFNARLDFGVDDTMIDGSGTIRMIAAGNLNDAQLNAIDGVTGTIGFDQTVAGSGTIEGKGATGTIVNLGLVLADDPAELLELRGTHSGAVMAGSGTYRAANDCVLSLGGGMYLTTATLETEGTGQVAVVGGNADLAYGTNNGTLALWGDGTTLRLHGSLVNDGTIDINSNASIFNANLRLMTEDLQISGMGNIIMITAGNENDAQLSTDGDVVGTLGEHQTLMGDGQINGEFNILGTIDPGGPSRMFKTDTINLDSGSQMHIDLGGPIAPDYDRVVVRNGEMLNLNDATLTISIDSGYVPAFGDTWDIIEGNTSGTFAEVITDVAPFGQVYRVIYTSSSVYVILTCDADLSGDGVIDFFDVSAFLTYFSGEDVRGDLNGDGLFNFFDISLFLQIFGQGCEA